MEYKDIKPSSSPYLKRLTYLSDPPKKLFFYGKIPDFDGKTEASKRFPEEFGRPKTVAIVGARKMTSYGESIAFKIASELASRGVIIASGMALGIDASAHKGALSVGGKTIAFLGTEITNIYPPQNRGLFDEILESNGAVFSEYGPGELEACRLGTDSFLRRNRLIAGISDAVIVVEADIKSGSLNTATHAMSEGIPVFAVPGDINRQMSRGCNKLLSKGAFAYTSVDDILEVLYSKPKRKTKKSLKSRNLVDSKDEEFIVEAISKTAGFRDEILDFIRENLDSSFDISRFLTAIMTLELKNVVIKEGDSKWILA